MTYKENIKQLLKDQGLNNSQLAEKIGKTRPHINSIFNANNITIKLLDEIAKALDVPTFWLLDEDGYESSLKLRQEFVNISLEIELIKEANRKLQDEILLFKDIIKKLT